MNNGAGGSDACGFCSYVWTLRDDDDEVSRSLREMHSLSLQPPTNSREFEVWLCHV